MNKMDLPILPLRGVNVFPKMFLHFNARRKASIEALTFAMDKQQTLFVSAQKDPSVEDVDVATDIYEVGTVVRIKQIVKLPGDVSRVLVEGLYRGCLEKIYHNDGLCPLGIIRVWEDEEKVMLETERQAQISMALEVVEKYGRAHDSKPPEATLNALKSISDVGMLADSIANHLIKALESKQRVLEESDSEIRMQLVLQILNHEIELAQIRQKLQRKTKSVIEKNQKDYYLREQLKVIQSELGDAVDVGEEIEEYKIAIQNLDADEKIKEKILKEVNRLQRMTVHSAESSVIRNYVECMLEMPWNVMTEEEINLKKAEQILEDEHYGLSKVKERVLEHLAVRKMTQHGMAPIICLVGPPGTGKTSIAKAIAASLQRHYIRISLGGVRDEAEIRGHRRTYIGAMPGRLVTALRQAGTSNPMILLDEIDKMNSDFKGDPSAALLEVLDSEQNHQFRDHYLEVPVDLSKVLFVATANTLRTIPRPLLDRLEIIEVASYTENEKYHIAEQYLIPKQLKKHGLTKSQLRIKEEAIYRVVNEYTREAGVRQLERRIGEICRKTAKEFLMEHKKTITVSGKRVEKYLGIPKISYEMKYDEPQVGVARGLAWTEVGGDTLSIEVTVMPGKGKFQITGCIGDIMKESASTAMSYIRSKSQNYGLANDFYETVDIHIHIPEGAVPKDGPSAGITLVVSMLSALIHTPIRHDIAMTGEVTLRGRVLAIGGLKEKILAAKRADIFEVIVPENNRRTISELDDEVIENVKIHYVKDVSDVIELALVAPSKEKC